MTNESQFYGGLSSEHLRQFIERLERLAEERQNISEDIKEVFQEVKSNGFDVKTIKEILKIRKIEAAELEEAEYLLDTYMKALGMKIESEEKQPNTLMGVVKRCGAENRRSAKICRADE